MIVLVFFTIVLFIPANLFAVPKQYLYTKPSPHVKNVKEDVNMIRGPIIGTPRSGLKRRWNNNTNQDWNEDYNESDHTVLQQSDYPNNPYDTSSENKTHDMSPEDRMIQDRHNKINKITSKVAEEYNQLSNEIGNTYSTLNKYKEELSNASRQEDEAVLYDSEEQAYPDKEINNMYPQESSYNTYNRSVNLNQNQQNTVSDVFSENPFASLTQDEMKKKINQYNQILQREAKRAKYEQQKIELDEASNFLYADYADKYNLDDVEKEGNNIIIYKETPNQKRAKKFKLPPIPKVELSNWIFQITPPNISQKIYSLTNYHLNPVMFQYEIDKLAFQLTKDIYSVSKFSSLIYKITDINMQDHVGNTLLMHSIGNLNYDIANLIIRNGGNVNISNNFGVTPLHLAVYKQDYEAISMILTQSPDTNTFDYNDLTPIMYAVILDDIEIIKALIDNGASVTIKNKKGMNAITIAEEYDDIDLINYLKSNTFDFFNQEDNQEE